MNKDLPYIDVMIRCPKGRHDTEAKEKVAAVISLMDLANSFSRDFSWEPLQSVGRKDPPIYGIKITKTYKASKEAQMLPVFLPESITAIVWEYIYEHINETKETDIFETNSEGIRLRSNCFGDEITIERMPLYYGK